MASGDLYLPQLADFIARARPPEDASLLWSRRRQQHLCVKLFVSHRVDSVLLFIGHRVDSVQLLDSLFVRPRGLLFDHLLFQSVRCVSTTCLRGWPRLDLPFFGLEQHAVV